MAVGQKNISLYLTYRGKQKELLHYSRLCHTKNADYDHSDYSVCFLSNAKF